MSTYRLPSGRVIIEPQAIGVFNVGVPPRGNVVDTGTVLVLGTSEGGSPMGQGTIHEFANYREAQDVLRSGESLRCIKYLFNPSNQHRGATAVYYIRVASIAGGTPVQAQSTFPGAGGDAIRFLANDYGTWCNRIRIDVDATGADRTIRIHDDVDSDNTLDSTELLETFTVTAATNTTLVAAVNHARTGSQLVTASIAPNGTTFLLAATADYVDLGTTPAGAVEAGILGVGTTGLLADGDLANLSTALGLAQTTQAWFALVVAGTATTLWTAVDAHLRTAADVPGFQFCGGATGINWATAFTHSGTTLNTEKTAYVWPGIYDYTEDGTGVLELLAPLYHAAFATGLAAGLPPQRPLTRKVLSIQGLEEALDGTTRIIPLNATRREQAIERGILTTVNRPGKGFCVLQGINTLQDNDQLWEPNTDTTPEISLLRTRDVLIYELTTSLDNTFIGGDKGEFPAATIETFVVRYLDTAVENKLILDYSSVTITDADDYYRVEFNFNGNNPVNFIVVLPTVVA